MVWLLPSGQNNLLLCPLGHDALAKMGPAVILRKFLAGDEAAVCDGGIAVYRPSA